MKISNNLLLYGPPGTGKTYNTVNYAVAIVENRPLETIIKEGYDLALEKYDRYTKLGRIDFMTFHQSLGYDDFIEGIRPVVLEDNSLIYKASAGTFYQFCEKAEHPTLIDDLPEDDTAVASNLGPFNGTESVWIVCPGGFGDNKVRAACFRRDKMAISSENGTGMEEGFKGARKGDVIISMYAANMIDGIGIFDEDVSAVRNRPASIMYAAVRWLKKFREETGMCKVAEVGAFQAPSRFGMPLDKVAALLVEEEEVPEEGTVAKKTEGDVGNCVFIIDEINRGNISRIFGELITLLESSRRKGMPECLEAYLPQLKVKFSIPQNVFVLGTMNTADKSLAALDTALRRRFEFVEMMPNPDVLHGRRINDIDLTRLLHTINNRVELLYDREHMLGHAYLISVKTMDQLAECFIKKIIPLLQEYFFDDYEKMCWVLGDARNPRSCPFIRIRKRNSFQSEFDLPDVFDIVDDYQVFMNPENYIQIYKGAD